MSERVENPPAFPNSHDNGFASGMSLRDWFAGQALAFSLATNAEYISKATKNADETAFLYGVGRDAYRIADAMLTAREVQP